MERIQKKVEKRRTGEVDKEEESSKRRGGGEEQKEK